MRRTLVLATLLASATSVALGGAAADPCAPGQDAVFFCAGDASHGEPGCESDGSFGFRQTGVIVGAGPTTAAAGGFAACENNEHARYDVTVVGAAVFGSFGRVAVEWIGGEVEGEDACAVVVTADVGSGGSHAVECPADTPPPDPGWGAVLP